MGMRDADCSSQAGDDDAEDQPDVPRTILAFDRAIRIAEEGTVRQNELETGRAVS